MSQQLLSGHFSGRSQALRIVDDYGPIGRGASAARSVLAENGQEYLVKGPSLAPQHPYAAANEFVAASLADQLGLPLLDYRILRAGSDYFFGSSLMPPGTFYDTITADLFRRCSNLEQVYGLVVLDAWICNIDRHEGNLLARNAARRGGRPNLILLLNDHSHCLVLPGETPAALAAKVGWDIFDPSHPLVRLPFVQDAVTDVRRLRSAVDSAAAVSNAVIGGVLASLPPDLLPETERPAFERFLQARRDNLLTVIRHAVRYFDALGGGQL